MLRTRSLLLFALFAGSVAAQEIPGVRATLSTQRHVVTAGGNVDLRLLIDVTQDAEVPSDLLSGIALETKVDDKPGPRIEEKGRGGAVFLVAGTRLERRISLPAARFVPAVDGSSFAVVAVSWAGVAGVNCVFKVAPDTSRIDLATLDFARTQVLLVTSKGEMTLSFRPDKAPGHVENFLKLCKQGFYDGTKFHRVISGFMIQGGDPYTKDDGKQAQWGQGGPGYKIKAELNDLRHVRGTLSMAREPGLDTAGSQFFIVHKDATSLDMRSQDDGTQTGYTAFGNLVAGADTLDAIATTPRAPNDRPLEPVVLHAAVILPVRK